MEKLERFILENRAKLDVLSPSKGCDQRFKEILNDNIEKEVVRVRSELNDTYTPSNKIWSRIESELNNNLSSVHKEEKALENTSFDKFDTPSGLWDKIEAELDQDDNKKVTEQKPTKEIRFTVNKMWASIAAMLVIGIGIGWFGKGNFNTNQNTNSTSVKNEWSQAEGYYMTMISNKRTQINALHFEDVKLLDDFNDQLKQLQREYVKLKKEEEKSAEPELVRRQMVINLELQIELLNKQMEIIINARKPQMDYEEVKHYSI